MSRGMCYLPPTSWAKRYAEIVPLRVCERGGRRYLRGSMMVRVQCGDGLYRGDGSFRVELKRLGIGDPPASEIPPKPKSVPAPLILAPERDRRAVAAAIRGLGRLTAGVRHDIDVSETHRPNGKRKGKRRAKP